MLVDLLKHESVLVRIGVATTVAFAPLYILSSMGYKWPWVISLLIFAAMMIQFVGIQGMDFYGRSNADRRAGIGRSRGRIGPELRGGV